MGLDMYLFANKYASEFRGGCEYPKELSKIASTLENRSPRSVESKFKIGYWCKAWDIHNVIMENAETKTKNTADLTVNDMTAIVDALEAMRINAETKSELDYSISLFKNAISLAQADRYDITYYASW